MGGRDDVRSLLRRPASATTPAVPSRIPIGNGFNRRPRNPPLKGLARSVRDRHDCVKAGERATVQRLVEPQLPAHGGAGPAVNRGDKPGPRVSTRQKTEDDVGLVSVGVRHRRALLTDARPQRVSPLQGEAAAHRGVRHGNPERRRPERHLGGAGRVFSDAAEHPGEERFPHLLQEGQEDSLGTVEAAAVDQISTLRGPSLTGKDRPIQRWVFSDALRKAEFCEVSSSCRARTWPWPPRVRRPVRGTADEIILVVGR